MMNRSQKRFAGAALVLTLILIALGVYETRKVRATWDRIDSASQRFQQPDGIEQVARVRQGTAFCWVSCTEGGEAIVTLVFSSKLGVDETCDRLRASLAALNRRAVTPASFESTCSWRVALTHGAYARASVDESSRLSGAGSGWRWMEKVPVPSSAVVAWVEFNSGSE
jgi:hypothetical protein